jgi:hypothetical protein
VTPEYGDSNPTFYVRRSDGEQWPRIVGYFEALEFTARSRDSSVGIATSYGLDDRGSDFESRWSQELSLLQIVETDYEVHPTSYPMGTGGSFPGGKRPGREVDHSPPTSAEVKKMWIYTSTPHTPSWRSA